MTKDWATSPTSKELLTRLSTYFERCYELGSSGENDD
jgi:hypothetical protein